MRICDTYQASIYRRQLDTETTLNEINSWAEKSTGGLINPMIEKPLASNSRMVLANAFYFRGLWATPFDKNDTYKSKFSCLDGTETTVDMMVYPDDTVSYTEGDILTTVYLPFGNGAYNMTFILPNEGVDLETAEATMTAEKLNTLASKAVKQPRALMIPKYSISDETYLRESLKTLGFEKIFSNDAYFPCINPYESLWVDDIIQKSIITVDESGAEGAATTITKMDNAAAAPIILNRPFIFLISEKSSGAILFVGDVKQL